MTEGKTRKTLADYVAIAVSPVLIMALIGSLVFFLVAILYKGEYAARLHWILFFFVFGAVLIARISMQGEIADRAGLYGLVLGSLVWLALIVYVDWKDSGPAARFGWLIDLGLVAVVWWCAHRLTWDCTLIDDTVDASGVGLLQEAGLDQPSGPTGADAAGEEEPAEKLPGLVGWWERYRRYREEQRRKPHAPGVWVVYFSLAALPIFGLGQSLIPPEDVGRRRYVFWLMIVYVGSGLGLLLTTCFLGLRRYLRQRKLQMPRTMTGAWLLAGGILIATLLVVGALLPRPSPEYHPLGDWLADLAGSPERKASRHDQLGGNPGKDEGRAAGEKGDQKDKDGAAREGRNQDKERGDEKDGEKGSARNKGERNGPGKDSEKDKAGQDKQEPQRDRREETRDGDRKDAQDRKPDGQQGNVEKKEGREDGQPNGAPPDSPQSDFLKDFTRQLANLLKWVVGILLGLVVLFFVLRSGLRFLANFTHWVRGLLAALQSFWQGLLAWLRGTGRAGEEGEAAAKEEAAPPRPFAAFADPFSSGAAERMSHEQLVRYTFEALHAWAAERDLGRQPGETPLEFAGRVGEELPALEDGARRLVNYYAQIAYARGKLTRACRAPLRQFWQLLIDAVERPMSAGVGGATDEV